MFLVKVFCMYKPRHYPSVYTALRLRHPRHHPSAYTALHLRYLQLSKRVIIPHHPSTRDYGITTSTALRLGVFSSHPSVSTAFNYSIILHHDIHSSSAFNYGIILHHDIHSSSAFHTHPSASATLNLIPGHHSSTGTS